MDNEIKVAKLFTCSMTGGKYYDCKHTCITMGRIVIQNGETHVSMCIDCRQKMLKYMQKQQQIVALKEISLSLKHIVAHFDKKELGELIIERKE